MNEMQDRVLNFLENWIEASIVRVSHDPFDDVDTMRYRFLTDAVAAGIPLEEVNTEWDTAETAITKAIERRRETAGLKPASANELREAPREQDSKKPGR
jgi:hypothetical protein